MLVYLAIYLTRFGESCKDLSILSFSEYLSPSRWLKPVHYREGSCDPYPSTCTQQVRKRRPTHTLKLPVNIIRFKSAIITEEGRFSGARICSVQSHSQCLAAHDAETLGGTMVLNLATAARRLAAPLLSPQDPDGGWRRTCTNCGRAKWEILSCHAFFSEGISLWPHHSITHCTVIWRQSRGLRAWEWMQ